MVLIVDRECLLPEPGQALEAAARLMRDPGDAAGVEAVGVVLELDDHALHKRDDTASHRVR
jgi:hypothetical protein